MKLLQTNFIKTSKSLFIFLFILFIQKQCLMCSILISDSSEDKPNPPDPQLIDQALLTLKQIETEGILECCDKR